MMGRRRIAGFLARAGLHLAASTARRMLNRKPAAEPTFAYGSARLAGMAASPSRSSSSAPSKKKDLHTKWCQLARLRRQQQLQGALCPLRGNDRGRCQSFLRIQGRGRCHQSFLRIQCLNVRNLAVREGGTQVSPWPQSVRSIFGTNAILLSPNRTCTQNADNRTSVNRVAYSSTEMMG